MTAVSPIQAGIAVDAPQDRAFDAFTREIGRWWPLAYTYAQAELDTAVIEPRAGGLWFERDRAGRETAWGEVRAWEPPSRLVLSFAVSPERAPEPEERASEVEIRFVPEQGRTRIELEHRDFERHGDGAARLRDGMASPGGWPLILADFARYIRG
ncbi:SRPBCC family protein [Inquilinus sp. NPDC058860]|uniref:SRPBCC family protein n=1 Tax=Inquilinus sp. NPDC058860 TaxID=3346652 RepID=UPI0036A807BB